MDAPPSLLLLTSSDSTLIDPLRLVFDLPGEGPFVLLVILLDAALFVASVKDAPPLSLLFPRP